MTQTTVRELATANPAAVRVFKKYGIDYCCGGYRPFAVACGERGLSAEAVLAEIAALVPSGAPEPDWSGASLTDLVAHIVNRHHAYLNRELPALEAAMQQVVAKHGPKYPEMLPRLEEIFAGLKAELESHLRKEEAVLFPAILELEAAEAGRRTPPVLPFGTVRNPIRMMEHEHDQAGQALAAMRSLSRDYAVPDDACPTFRGLYHSLDELEQDLHTHIHLENNILFPRAAALEASLG
jgi:regulator of cell morphogenesis and NO signaling